MFSFKVNIILRSSIVVELPSETSSYITTNVSYPPPLTFLIYTFLSVSSTSVLDIISTYSSKILKPFTSCQTTLSTAFTSLSEMSYLSFLQSVVLSYYGLISARSHKVSSDRILIH